MKALVSKITFNKVMLLLFVAIGAAGVYLQETAPTF